MKVACTVWSGGKSGDNFKGLPIAIGCKITGNQAAYEWRWGYPHRYTVDSTVGQLILNAVGKENVHVRWDF